VAAEWLSWEKLFGSAQTLEICFKQQVKEVHVLAAKLEPAKQRPKRPATKKVEELAKEVHAESENERSMLSSGSNRKKHTLFLRNLSDQTEEADLEGLFKDFVPNCHITAIRLIRDESG